MKIITLHNNEANQEMNAAINKADRHADIHACTDLEAALELMKDGPVDAIFVDYQLPGYEPEEVYAKLEDAQEKVNVIYVIEDNSVALNPELSKKASGIVYRTVKGNDCRRELDNLRYKVAESDHEYFDPDSLKHAPWKPF